MEFRTDVTMVGGAKVTGLPNAVSSTDAVPFGQIETMLEGRSFVTVRLKTTANINLASPGASIDGVTPDNGDLFLAGSQTDLEDNGIYVYNGAATPATRAPGFDDTFEQFEGLLVRVQEGTANGQTAWAQTQVNGTLDTDDLIFTSFDPNTPDATSSVAGKVELATLSELNAGTATGGDGPLAVGPDVLDDWDGKKLKFSDTFGDGSSTQFDFTHNFDTVDLTYRVFKTSNNETVIVDGRSTDADTFRVNVVAPPSNDELTIVISA